MRIGPMKQRITIQRYTATNDTYEQPRKIWTDLKTVWADVQPLTGKEFWSAEAANSDVQGKMFIRHYPTLHTTDRILMDERIFEILSLIHLKEEKRITQIFYREVKRDSELGG